MNRKRKYAIGTDFGTRSVRSELIDVNSGEEVCGSIYEYRDGVIDDHLPDSNLKLPYDSALQNPKDYEDGIIFTINEIINQTKINPTDIIGLGIDFTSCTMMPVKADSTPLCFIEKYKKDHNSWVKLWKDHTAHKYALRLNKIAMKRNEKFLLRYGGKISSEWLIPKIMQIADQSPKIYNDADLMIEGGDWIVFRLTGNLTRNISGIGFKAIWNGSFPSLDFFKSLNPRFKNIYDKLNGKVLELGKLAGYLNRAYQKKLNLPRIPVASANLDAHVAVPATTVIEPGKMAMIMGTSTCHMVLDKRFKEVPGIRGIVKDGIISGYFGYECGQASVGDVFEWFIKNAIPYNYYNNAEEKGISIHDYLTKLAEKLRPGESGLICLDWLNGNRSVLMNNDLSGLVLGITLLTKPEEIYRALIEATAFGTKKIIETFEKSGIKIESLYACGGLAQKNKMLMQIYADISEREISIAKSTQTGCLGSAMHAAVATGYYKDIKEAVKYMAHLKDEKYKPKKENLKIYRKLYEQYLKLHDFFGLSLDSIMKILKKMRNENKKFNTVN